MNSKAIKRQLLAAIAMVLVAALALGSSTYAWFVNNTMVKAESVTVSAKAANTLLISHANENAWGTTAKFSAETVTTFVPVSTINATSFFKDKTWGTETGADNAQKGEYTAQGFEAATPGTDYFVDTFQVKASQNCGLYLDSETEFTTTGNANVLKSLRLALVVDGGGTFFYQVDASKIDGEGNSYNTTLVSLAADGVQKAISATDNAGAIAASNLSNESKVIALSDGTVTKPENNTTLVEKDDAKKLCDLTANTAKTITVYIWMEGCDYDCNTVVVKQITEQAVNCVLGFVAGKST